MVGLGLAKAIYQAKLLVYSGNIDKTIINDGFGLLNNIQIDLTHYL
jgi:hypothetical protein